MRFLDVDDEKLRLIFEVFVQLFEFGDRRAEGRSRVAAENQDDVAISFEGGELNGFAPVGCFQREVRRFVSHLKVANATLFYVNGPLSF